MVKLTVYLDDILCLSEMLIFASVHVCEKSLCYSLAAPYTIWYCNNVY